MNKDMIVDTVNSILKDNFNYVPLYTSMRVADELIKQGVIKTIETTSKKEKIEVFSSITKEEAEKFIKKKLLLKACRIFKRYWQQLDKINKDGQGKLLSNKGNPIDEKSKARKYVEAFVNEALEGEKEEEQ